MNALLQWAKKWGISPEALSDLPRILTAKPSTPLPVEVQNESGIMGLIRLAGSRENWRLFRNNVGAVHTADGRFIRYGLANESKRMNESLKSSDLIGIRPLLIDPTYLGRTVGQFVAIECKRPGWKPGNTEREKAQSRFLTLVQSLGGHGIFSTGGLE